MTQWSPSIMALSAQYTWCEHSFTCVVYMTIGRYAELCGHGNNL
jgi:hypothetical protein